MFSWKICMIYLDDIIVFSRTFSEHLENLKLVFQRLREANLKMSPKKCCLFQHQVSFLGHVVSKDGIATDPDKIEAVVNWPTPKCVKDVRMFLGLCSYYRKFVHKFAEIARPLHKQTELYQTFTWGDDCQKAFEILKRALTSSPILAYPQTEGLFVLDTDASKLLAIISSILQFHHYLYGQFFKVRTDHGALTG